MVRPRGEKAPALAKGSTVSEGWTDGCDGQLGISAERTDEHADVEIYF